MWKVRVPSWANSVVVIGVGIDALLAGKAKANALAVLEGVGQRARAQAQQRSSQEVSDFLMRVPGTVRRWGDREGFEFGHGRHFDGKRCSC
jgi:hypothetical protein